MNRKAPPLSAGTGICWIRSDEWWLPYRVFAKFGPGVEESISLGDRHACHAVR